MNDQLSDELHARITALCDKGNELTEEGDFEKAIDPFRSALELIPKPIENWEAATYVLAALGDCYFMLEDFETAHYFFARAMYCPGAIGTPFMHLRLGEIQYELGNQDRAKDELARAYMGGGREIFEGEDPKYFQFIRQFLRDVK